jgi:hypothetical protein
MGHYTHERVFATKLEGYSPLTFLSFETLKNSLLIYLGFFALV